MVDREGIIRLWNAGAQAIFGYPADEAIGQGLDLIIPEQFRNRHWDGFRKVIETGVTRYGKELLSVPAMRKDNARISVEFSVMLVHGQAAEIIGIAAILRDVTEHWMRDREMRQRLAELQARST
jgi:PAS domain S-box-containing protein